MTVLVHGVGYANRGAELLLAAVARRVQGWPDQPRLAVSVRCGTFGQRRRTGVSTHLSIARLGPAGGLGLGHLPAAARRRLRVSVDSDLRLVLDASGYVLGDGWGPEPARWLLRRVRRWRALGVPIVLLPQAFGPFEDAAVRAIAAAVVRASSLVFSRDRVSLGHLRGLLAGEPAADRFRLAPDITVGLPVQRRVSPGAVPIIPNWNIPARTAGPERRSGYLRSLRQAVHAARAAGLDPFGLCHEGAGDLRLLDELSESVRGLRVVRGLSGPECRALIAGSRLVVSGRFHGCVSALSAGVPTVLHGWSHKYAELAEDFGVARYAVDPYDPGGTEQAVLAGLSDPGLGPCLLAAARRCRDRVEEMWQTVESLGREPG
jgi:colanic acid/amylovoran biosynthesis protein